MDRNEHTEPTEQAKTVALRKESVDRNCINLAFDVRITSSLSARRAWIEMIIAYDNGNPVAVALRKESVDRNFIGCINRAIDIMSLSARRAWIEIMGRHEKFVRSRKVALRKESVDRNTP